MRNRTYLSRYVCLVCDDETHSPGDHQGPTVAGVCIGDNGDVAVEAGNHGGVADHVVDGGQAQVGQAQDGHGGAGARHVEVLEAFAEADAGRETILHAGADDDVALLCDLGAQFGGGSVAHLVRFVLLFGVCSTWEVQYLLPWCVLNYIVSMSIYALRRRQPTSKTPIFGRERHQDYFRNDGFSFPRRAPLARLDT